MRANIEPHALTEGAALSALTAVERGRLDHIARCIPPMHSTGGEPVVTPVGLRGRPLLRRWVTVVATAEALGFAIPAIVGATTASAPASVAVPALLAAGAFEGMALGLGQAFVLRRAIPHLSAMRWAVATAVASMLAYALGLLPSSVAWDWPTPVTMAAAGVLGLLILLTIGSSQWLVLREHLPGASRWILITASAWLAGLVVFIGFSTPLWHEGQALLTTIAIGVFGGLLMAIVTALVTGVGLVRMLSSRGRIA